MDASRLLNLPEASRPCSGRKGRSWRPTKMNHTNGHPLARSTSLVSSLDLVSSPEAELGKRRRLADGKRHRRMESAPVRGRRRKIFRSILGK